MGKHQDLYKTAVAKDSTDQMCCTVAEMMDTLERTNPQMYHDFLDKMEAVAYSIPRDEAERIVYNMRPHGQKWAYRDVESLCNEHQMPEKTVDYYLVLNMCYNDYYNTAKKYGLQNDTDFFWSLAWDFINDADGKPHKVARYFLD